MFFSFNFYLKRKKFPRLEYVNQFSVVFCQTEVDVVNQIRMCEPDGDPGGHTQEVPLTSLLHLVLSGTAVIRGAGSIPG